MKVVRLDHGEPQLWSLLGPFLCDRAVHKELGGPIYSAPGTTWFVATEGRTVVGFCSLRETASTYWYDYAYVIPSRRGSGVFSRLSEARDAHLATLEPAPVKIAVRRERWKHYRSRGWRVASERGTWIYGVKEP